MLIIPLIWYKANFSRIAPCIRLEHSCFKFQLIFFLLLVLSLHSGFQYVVHLFLKLSDILPWLKTIHDHSQGIFLCLDILVVWPLVMMRIRRSFWVHHQWFNKEGQLQILKNAEMFKVDCYYGFVFYPFQQVNTKVCFII